MNGRTIRKLLMRGRTGTFFGARALFVVRIPLAAIPEPRPPFKAPGKSSYEGCWRRDNEDGTETLFHIPELHGHRDPAKKKHRKDGFVPIIHHATCIESEIDEDGELHEDWVWYEGTEFLLGPQPDSSKLAPVLERKNLPADMVDAYVTRRRWTQKYCLGRFSVIGKHVPSEIPWLDELHEAARYARRFQPLIWGEVVDFAYFLKWWHPRMKLWFCAQMHRALKAAKRAGVDVRVLRPPRKR